MCMAQASIQVTLLQPGTFFFKNLPILLTCFFSSRSCKIMPSSWSSWSQSLTLSSLLASLSSLLSTCSSLLFRLSSSRVAFSMSHAKELSSVLFRICNSVLLYSDIISSIYSSLGNCSARFSMLTPFLPPFLFLQRGPCISLELESLRQICRLPPWKGAKHLGTSELICLLVS